MRRYLPFIRNAFLTMLAYRLRYYTGIFTYTVFVSVHYFIWRAVFESGERIHGFTFPEMVSYVTLGWMSRSLYFSDIDEEIDDLVRTGQVGISLLRPVDFQLMMLAQAFGGMLFRLSFFTLPLGILLMLVFPVLPPASLLAFFLFLGATFLSFLILAELNFIVGLAAFHLKSIQGIVRAKYWLIQLFSGLLLPLSFFPEELRRVLELLPFPAIAAVPLQLYLGKVSGSALVPVLSLQIGWAIVLYFLGRALWDRAMTHLTVQGG